jgi:hypothetical protein
MGDTMLKTLAGTILVAAAATTLMAAPADASTQLISTKISFGHCEDTCKIKVRIKNKSGKTLFYVKLNAKLKVNGHKAGTCYDSVGTIRAYRVRYATCTVRTATLTNLWNDAYDNGSRWRPYANTYVSYRYYR